MHDDRPPVRNPLIRCQRLWFEHRSCASKALRFVRSVLGERKALTTGQALLADVNWHIEPGTHWFCYSRQPQMLSALRALLMGQPGVIQGQVDYAYSAVIHLDTLIPHVQSAQAERPQHRQLLIIDEASLIPLTREAPQLVAEVCQSLTQAGSSLVVMGQHPEQVSSAIQSLVWWESGRMMTQGARAAFSEMMHHSDFPPVAASAWHKRAFIQQYFQSFEATDPHASMETPSAEAEGLSWQVKEGVALPLAQVLALFEASFGHRLSPETWCWKYRETDNPGTLVYDYGDPTDPTCSDQPPQLVAFNGGMPRQIEVDQQSVTAVQMGDVMVHPQYRGILTRRGPFYLAVSHYFSTRIGVDKPYPYTFGFPNKRHAVLGKKRGLYCDIDVILDVRWPTAQRYTRWIERALMRRATLHDAPIMARLWQAMRPHLAKVAVGQRDPGWIISRYLEKPDGHYQLWLVFSPWHSQAVGMIILQPSDPHTMELLDIIGTPAHAPRLIRAAQHLSAQQGFQCLYSWMTPTTLTWFEATSPQVNATDIVIPGSAVGGSQQASQLRNRWWLMGGDTDFH